MSLSIPAKAANFCWLIFARQRRSDLVHHSIVQFVFVCVRSSFCSTRPWMMGDGIGICFYRVLMLKRSDGRWCFVQMPPIKRRKLSALIARMADRSHLHAPRIICVARSIRSIRKKSGFHTVEDRAEAPLAHLTHHTHVAHIHFHMAYTIPLTLYILYIYIAFGPLN